MLSLKNSVSLFILLNVFAEIKTLVELPFVEDNNIATTESDIRKTVDKIFAIFKVEGVMHRPRLKQYATIHNFFVSITLRDCNNLKEIARFTTVNNIDNNTQSFIALINEVLNEDDKSYESNDSNNEYVTKHIGMFIRKLKYLRERYVSHRNSVNTNILRYLENDEKLSVNFTKVNYTSSVNNSDENAIGDDEFWRASGRRIYQGKRASIKKFPFMASVLFFKSFQCAGSILKNDLVITSASCLQLAWNNRFFRENPAFLSVQIGSDAYEGGEDIAVIEIYFYPKYDPQTLKHNIALMRLRRKINFKNKSRVKKIDFDRNPFPMSINSPRITIIGWGAKDTSNVISDVFRNKLSYAELDYYPLKDCQDHYSADFVTERNFCAGFISIGGGACNRDAGGPGVIENTLFGVVSFGSPICGAPDAPTVFTKLGFYADWIETIMEQEIPSISQRTTTRAPNTLYLLNLEPQTPSTLKTYPLLTTDSTHSTPPVEDLDHLRIAQDQGFKDFLATMFSSEDIKEYFDKSNEDKDNTNNSEASDMLEIQEEPSTTSKETKATKSKHKPSTVPTTPHTKLVSSSAASKSHKSRVRQTTTESNQKITVLDNVSVDDKTLEDDIMTLIDNLDIDKILKPETPVKTAVAKQNIPPDVTAKKKEKINVKVASASGENNVIINPKQQSVLNFLFLSEENKDKQDDDEEGLNIQADNFRDLTFRDRPNNTKKHDVLSETALYELISVAIDEEAKRLHKGKRYSL